MIISGTITQVEAPDYTDPKYGNQYQNIGIDDGQGQGVLTGRIGCKSPYTQADVGAQGQWELEPAKNAQGAYNKLKKYYSQPYQQTQGQQPQQSVGSYRKLSPPPAGGQWQPPQGRQPTKPTNNKDQLIVAQVVYKALVEKFTDIGEFDLWLMSNQPIFHRHIKLIMQAGSQPPMDEVDVALGTSPPNY